MQKIAESPVQGGAWQPPVAEIADLIDSREQETSVHGKVKVLGDFPTSLFHVCRGTKHSGAVLATELGSVTVHLGPPWFFCQNNFPIRVGDFLEAIGSRLITPDDRIIILAREIRTNGKSLRLRDKDGVPLWD